MAGAQPRSCEIRWAPTTGTLSGGPHPRRVLTRRAVMSNDRGLANPWAWRDHYAVELVSIVAFRHKHMLCDGGDDC